MSDLVELRAEWEDVILRGTHPQGKAREVAAWLAENADRIADAMNDKEAPDGSVGRVIYTDDIRRLVEVLSE